MARLSVYFDLLNAYSDEKKSDILFQIMEQVNLVGEDNLDTIGCYVLEVLKENYLVFPKSK